MKLPVTIEVWRRKDWYVARTPELDFISQGKTPEEAKDHLLEVIKIQFEEMKAIGTLEDYLFECGFQPGDDEAIPAIEIVSFEKSLISV